MIQRLLVCVLAAGCVVGFLSRAHGEPAANGDAVALLPLDTDRSLEIYGQPIANALARALGNAKLPVVVVGSKMAVPEHVRLIIDGTVGLGKASAITISIRIRSTLDGKILETLSASAPGLAQIDSAATELATRVLPTIQDKLAALQRQAQPPDDHDHGRVIQTPRPPQTDRVVLVATVDVTRLSVGAPLLGALDAAAPEWLRAHHRQIEKLDPSKLDSRLPPPKAVTTGAADLAIGFWVLDYKREAGALPMARARVRVRVADASAVVFDRVVVTDTVLGEREFSPPELAARVAREVLAILRPHLRRHVPSWE